MVSSSRTRSADTMPRDGARAAAAARVAGSTSKPSWEAKRAARIIRKGSSPKLRSGSMGVRSRPPARSTRPSNGSTNSIAGRRTAIALTVKSRRARSPSSESPNVTAGLRVAPSYSSARYVVTSTWRSPRITPMVPNSRPMSHVLPPHLRSSLSVSSGRADVAKSKSALDRPRNASRTGPPTSANSYPASSKTRARSRTSGGSAGHRASARARSVARVGGGVVTVPKHPRWRVYLHQACPDR